MTKKFYADNEEEMLQKLKTEIIRLGLEKTPSRILIEKRYNNANMPHPMTYVNHFGKWTTLMERIGLENTRLNEAKEEKYEYKTFQFIWEEHAEDFWLENLIEELCRVQLNENPSVTELRKVYDKLRIPSPSTYMKHFGSWENVLKRIETDTRIKRKRTRIRYPKVRVSPTVRVTTKVRVKNTAPKLNKYDSVFPKGPSQPVLINAMLDEMKTKKLYSRKDYLAKYNDKFLPSIYTFTRATGLNWKALWKIYTERFGDPIKQERAKYASNLNLFLLD